MVGEKRSSDGADERHHRHDDGPHGALTPGAARAGAARLNFIARSPKRSCRFRIDQRSGVWVVTKNDTFYGDYLSRGQAIESACFGARAVEAQGGSAEVLATPGDERVDHRTAARKT